MTSDSLLKTEPLSAYWLLGAMPMKSEQNRGGISRHFRREAKIMAAGLPLIVLLGVAAGFLLPRMLEAVAVDRCLDRGGTFDYSANDCVIATEVEDR